MLGDMLLKMVSALTPDDILRMKDGRLNESLKEIEAILHVLDRMTISWHDGKYGVMSITDVLCWADVREKLNSLTSALRDK